MAALSIPSSKLNTSSCETPNHVRSNRIFTSSSSKFTQISRKKNLVIGRKTAYPGSEIRTSSSSISASSLSTSSSLEFDVVVVGAGIIGLTIARQFLTGSDLSVAVVDANVPCSGATGAVNHGLMEVGYVDHQLAAPHHTSSALEVVDHDQTLSISMTATMYTMGNLVLGSSRQFAGFNTEVENSIIHRIWGSELESFFPTLRELDLADLSRSMKVRVGLRPYVPDGKPITGPVPGLPNLVLAAGHEGEGLCMALGTAEMVVDMVLGNATKVDRAPFSVQGRCYN